jgi:hypothetical protein
VLHEQGDRNDERHNAVRAHYRTVPKSGIRFSDEIMRIKMNPAGVAACGPLSTAKRRRKEGRSRAVIAANRRKCAWLRHRLTLP